MPAVNQGARLPAAVPADVRHRCLICASASSSAGDQARPTVLTNLNLWTRFCVPLPMRCSRPREASSGRYRPGNARLLRRQPCPCRAHRQPGWHLVAVVERDDIAKRQAPDAAAAPLGRLAGRAVAAGASLAAVQRAMKATGRRRAAVTSDDGSLLGLLCLKASRTGFCSDQDVRARAEGRHCCRGRPLAWRRAEMITVLHSGTWATYRRCTSGQAAGRQSSG